MLQAQRYFSHFGPVLRRALGFDQQIIHAKAFQAFRHLDCIILKACIHGVPRFDLAKLYMVINNSSADRISAAIAS